MESLVFTFGMIAGGIVAVIVMAMLFMAKKSADENPVAVAGYRPYHMPQQESREDLEPMIPCTINTAGQKL